ERIHRKGQLSGETFCRSPGVVGIAEKERWARRRGSILKANQVPTEQSAYGLGDCALCRIVEKLLLPQAFQELGEGNQFFTAHSRVGAERVQIRVSSLQQRFADSAEQVRTPSF